MGFQLRSGWPLRIPAGRVDLFLGGDASEVARTVLTHGGMVKMAVDGWVQASMPVQRVKGLNYRTRRWGPSCSVFQKEER